MKRIVKAKIFNQREHAFEDKVRLRELPKEKHKDLYQVESLPIEQIDLLTDRESMATGNDISTEEIEITSRNIRVSDHYVPVRFYQTPGKKESIVLYIHGGGMISGSVASKDNQCKYLAQESNAIVASIEYRLAPECMFPGALEDCLGILDWIQTLNMKHIIVGGDSAGGCLAAACCLKRNFISYLFLIYAALDLEIPENTDYHWDYSMYPMDEEDKELIMNRLFRFKQLAKDMKKLYIKETDSVRDPLVSPFYAKDLSNFPKTLMIEAEFDYYRICDELFAQKLESNHIDVEILDYQGLDHGFYDRIGELEQTKDCIEEIAKRIQLL